MIESKLLKQAYKVHETLQAIGTPEDGAKSADMLGEIVKVIGANIMLRRQLAYTKLKMK